jgi:ElaB/YqjD/DUF883 family membrane-anchored ribosome-binding protein
MHQQDTEELKHEIERTRARLAADVDAIGTKISPENVKNQVKQRVTEGVRHGMQTVKTSTRRAGHSLMDSARGNPLPLVLIGAGLGWLVYNARQNARQVGWREPEWDDNDLEDEGPNARERVAYMRERAGEKIHDVRERAGEKLEQVSHRMAQVRERAGERIVHAREGAQHFMQENPLAMGAIALAIGAGVGMLLPHTNAEDRIIGERRDRLLEQGKDKMRGVMQDAKQVAKHVAHEAKRVAEQDMSERGYDMSKGQTVPGGTEAPSTPSLSGPNEEFDSTLGRRPI